MKLDRITLVGMVAMTAVSTDLYLSGIPLIVAEFNATEADGQLTLGIFMLGISLGQLVYGPLSDFYGRKPVLYVGLIAYIIASFGCAVALSMEHLLLARLLQALAAASGPVLASHRDRCVSGARCRPRYGNSSRVDGFDPLYSASFWQLDALLVRLACAVFRAHAGWLTRPFVRHITAGVSAETSG